MTKEIGVLLINLGTPATPRKRDVFRYLIEFLTDERVIDIPWLKRQWVVRGLIVPARCKSSSDSYKMIWTEEGSPLLIHSRNLLEKLQKEMGQNIQVELAMRYQEPSIESALNKLKHVKELIVLPLFPQYASATTGSVHQKVMETLKNWVVIPKLTFINSFYDHPAYIDSYAEIAKNYDLSQYEKILFSFHGLPLRQLEKSDSFNPRPLSGYFEQCHQTAKTIAERFGLKKTDYDVSFQSRLGKDPWIEPYTADVIEAYPEKGVKKILVLCPAFVADCLETIHEIGIEYAHAFKQKGGEKLDLFQGLNDHASWVKALKTIVSQSL